MAQDENSVYDFSSRAPMNKSNHLNAATKEIVSCIIMCYLKYWIAFTQLAFDGHYVVG